MGRKMNEFNQSYQTGGVARPMDMSVDAGLRNFMLGVYNKMALGLILSAVLAYVVGTVAPVTQLVFGTPLVFVVQFGPIALLFGSMFFMRNPSPAGANILYWSVVALIGSGMGIWVYAAVGQTPLTTNGGGVMNITFADIALAFVMTAAAFGALSLWGYTTKRDLSGIGSALLMGMVGVIVLGIANIWLQSSLLELGLYFVILALMAGVIAWQTQSLKASYYAMAGDQRMMSVATTFGALNLYIAFINIFQILLSLLSRE